MPTFPHNGDTDPMPKGWYGLSCDVGAEPIPFERSVQDQAAMGAPRLDTHDSAHPQVYGG
jgi:hypothetical protein